MRASRDTDVLLFPSNATILLGVLCIIILCHGFSLSATEFFRMMRQALTFYYLRLCTAFFADASSGCTPLKPQALPRKRLRTFQIPMLLFVISLFVAFHLVCDYTKLARPVLSS
ncbi:hypothetical protein ARMSODRAFT_342757 [Armillaria solidipes]|uniref:Uncharacterized protein n=1 Tax=Armillaria solidipes TaxID=1076256 RepID=A0A2H3B772_9AGAR|nr:hypothetical protein ARMSODRAFT_342757 [Armillaria solidipes]